MSTSNQAEVLKTLETSLVPEVEKRAQDYLEDVIRQDRWGGSGVSYEKKYTEGGVIPHALFETVATEVQREYDRGLEIPLWEREKDTKTVELVQEKRTLVEHYRQRMRESMYSDHTSRVETNEKADQGVDDLEMQLADTGKYAALVALLPPEVMGKLPNFYTPERHYMRHMERVRRSQGATTIEMVYPGEACQNGVVHLQLGPFKSGGARYSSRIEKPAKYINVDKLQPGEITTTDELVYAVSSAGDALDTQNIDANPQIAQIHEADKEVTLRADLIGLAVIRRKTVERIWDPPREREIPVDKVIVLASPALLDAMQQQSLVVQNAILRERVENPKAWSRLPTPEEYAASAEGGSKEYFAKLAGAFGEEGYTEERVKQVLSELTAPTN